VTSSRAGAPIALVCALVIALACGDYARTNPFDPGVDVQMEIRGPDSSFSVGDTPRYEIATTPSFAHDSPRWQMGWQLGIPVQVEELSTPGTFVVRGYLLGLSAGPIPGVVRVDIGAGRSASKPVLFHQRPASLQAYGCFIRVNTWDGPRTIDMVVGGDARICSKHLDARGNPVQAYPAVTAVVRQNVIGLVPALDAADAPYLRLTGRSVGRTYVVLTGTASRLVDSILVNVR